MGRTRIYFTGDGAECSVVRSASDPGRFDFECWDACRGADRVEGLVWPRAKELFDGFVADAAGRVARPAPEHDGHEWLYVSEVAKIMRTSKENVRRLIEAGKLAAVKAPQERLHPESHTTRSDRRMVSRSDVDAYMRSEPATPRVVA